jgi:spore photoproduct lyase
MSFFPCSKIFLMSKTLYYPERIFVDKKCEKFPLTQKILTDLSHIPADFVGDPQDVIEEVKIARDPVGEGKKNLLITQQKGDYVKPCPCTPQYIGCNYFIVNTDLNCPLDCSYCILQLYLTNPLITVHVNTQQLWRQLDDFLHKNRGRMLRIGTGELGDSLALDHITHRSLELISYFSNRPHALFELKTKTANIDNLLTVNPSENIIIAWSLNSDRIAKEEEAGAPGIQERIEATRAISQAGYRVAFHFDPILLHQDWEQGYQKVVEEMLTQIDPTRIAWVSLGSLRFPPSLREIIRQRFPETNIIYEEFIKGRDGKFRYIKSLRLEMYRYIVQAIKKQSGDKIPVYFCMESTDIWKGVLKKTPKSKEEVEKLLTLPFGDR